MSLSEQQVQTLVQLAVTTTPDSMDCDGCFGRVAEFVELHLSNRPLSESMLCVEEHLRNCLCCKDEFEALKIAMESMGE